LQTWRRPLFSHRRPNEKQPRMPQPILSTSRLRFDKWRHEDADLLFAIHSSPLIQRGYPFPTSAWTRNAVLERLRRYMGEHERQGLTKWKLSLLDGTFVGRAGWSPWGHQIEIGYAVLPEFQGKGIAMEAAFALMEWAQARRSEDLVGFCLVGNYRSKSILERIGMKYEYDRVISEAMHAFYRLSR